MSGPAIVDVRQLRERLRREPRPSSVTSSLPVLFFGDGLSAEIATIGLNPSRREYLDKDGRLLRGGEQRFATLESLGAPSRDVLTDAQADDAIDVMRDYYDDGKPVYGQYFRHLSNFLAGAGASYGERSAVHLDLVQEATAKVWNELAESERALLLELDMPFLLWQLTALPRLKAAVFAGATVGRELSGRVAVDVHERGQTARLRWWLGAARLDTRVLPVGGWNYPLDRPTGLTKGDEIALGSSPYSWDGNVMTIDPVSTANPGWDDFIVAYNQFCMDRNGRGRQPNPGADGEHAAEVFRRPAEHAEGGPRAVRPRQTPPQRLLPPVTRVTSP